MSATIIPFPQQSPAFGSVAYYLREIRKLRPHWSEDEIEASAEDCAYLQERCAALAAKK